MRGTSRFGELVPRISPRAHLRRWTVGCWRRPVTVAEAAVLEKVSGARGQRAALCAAPVNDCEWRTAGSSRGVSDPVFCPPKVARAPVGGGSLTPRLRVLIVRTRRSAGRPEIACSAATPRVARRDAPSGRILNRDVVNGRTRCQ